MEKYFENENILIPFNSIRAIVKNIIGNQGKNYEIILEDKKNPIILNEAEFTQLRDDYILWLKAQQLDI